METPDTLLRVTNITELGETKSELGSVQTQSASTGAWNHVPLAGAGGGIDDCLRCLHGTEPRGIPKQKIVIRGGMKATNVDVPVSGDPILQTLLQRFDLVGRSEHRWNSCGDGR